MTKATDPARPPPGRSPFWKSLRQAVHGSQEDFTEGGLSRAIVLLAVPMVLEMVMESVFAICDVFFVSRLGSEAVATVGLSESLLTLVFSLAIGLSMGTTALVARRTGEKDPEGAGVAGAQAIVIGLVASVVVGAVGVLTGPQALSLLGASDEVVALGSGYARILLGGCGTVMLLFIINAIFRGAGDAAVAMRVLWLANLINLILDPCLIFGLGPFPELGVTGAAVATTVGRGTGVVYQFWILGKGTSRIRIRLSEIRLVPKVMRALLRVSAGGIVQVLVATCSWVALVRIIALFGSTAVAGYTIAIRVVIFSILPAWGMANAAATLVGQNLGAGKPDRAERSAWLTGLYNMVFLGGIAVLFLVFGESIIGLFSQDPAVLAIGVECLRIISYGYLFYALGMVLVQAFNGAGDTTTPSLINLFCYWLFQIPLAYWLAVTSGMGPTGVFWAIAIAETMITLAGATVFRLGRWKNRQV
ncbi:MAG: MATE family efflux transporter [Nitrospirae bacterium]|nr:MATE family efflux transporter [Nitrospirota bacterium]